MLQPQAIIGNCFSAYATGDRAALEKLLAEDLRFTSPYDRLIDRQTYFERCWPNHVRIRQHRITAIAGHGETWFVRYEVAFASGGTATNAEMFTIRDGHVHAIEVFFGDPVASNPGDAS
jgi:ketosteroid isomerase-like protein